MTPAISVGILFAVGVVQAVVALEVVLDHRDRRGPWARRDRHGVGRAAATSQKEREARNI